MVVGAGVISNVAVPVLGSIILTHSLDGAVPALKDYPAADRPRVATVFFAFRVMVGIGGILIAIGVVGALLWWRKKLFETRWYLRPIGYAWPLGFIAILAGWVTTESGRQPWIAYGILRRVLHPQIDSRRTEGRCRRRAPAR